MRYKEAYTLTQRTTPKGTKIWYVHLYDAAGRRVSRSTGTSINGQSIGEALNMVREGERELVSIEEFAATFFDGGGLDRAIHVRAVIGRFRQGLDKAQILTDGRALVGRLAPHRAANQLVAWPLQP